MIAVYNILCMLLCMVPMLSFLAASVAMALYGHPYFAAVFAMFAVLTSPKLQAQSPGCKDGKEEKKSYEELKKGVQEFKPPELEEPKKDYRRH